MTIRDSVLIFKSLTHFKGVYNKVYDYVESGEVILEIKNFTPFEDAFSELTPDEVIYETSNLTNKNSHIYEIININESMCVEPVISSPIASKLFNHLGLIVIGDSLYKHEYDYVYVKKIDKNEEIKFDVELDEIVEKIPVINSIITINSNTNTNEVQSRADLCQCDVFGSRSNYKISGELSKSCVGNIYADMRLDTKHRIKILGLWFYNSTSFLSQEGFVVYCDVTTNGEQAVKNFDKSCTDCSKIRSIVSKDNGCPCLVDSDTKHSGYINSGSTLYDCDLICNYGDDDSCYINCTIR